MNQVQHAKVDGENLCGSDSWRTAFSPYYADCLECCQVLLDRLPDGPWELWSNRRAPDEGDNKDDYGNFCDIGHRMFCLGHGRKQEPVKVLVEIDPDGLYWGWQEPSTHKPSEKPSMIFDHKVLFEICFTYGVEVEVEGNKGRIVKLRITEIKDEE